MRLCISKTIARARRWRHSWSSGTRQRTRRGKREGEEDRGREEEEEREEERGEGEEEEEKGREEEEKDKEELASFFETFRVCFLFSSFDLGLSAKFGGDFDFWEDGERWRDMRDIDSIESVFLVSGCGEWEGDFALGFS